MHRRVQAFLDAFQGGLTLCRTQIHAKVHATATIVVCSAGLYFGVSALDWAILGFAIAIVWIAEALNTAIEFLADEVTLERREGIKRAKDVAAFAVLVAAFAAAWAGILVFLPYMAL